MASSRAEISQSDPPTPGHLYPHRCQECPLLLSEDYGSRCGHCADCVRADLAARTAEPEHAS